MLVTRSRVGAPQELMPVGRYGEVSRRLGGGSVGHGSRDLDRYGLMFSYVGITNPWGIHIFLIPVIK